MASRSHEDRRGRSDAALRRAGRFGDGWIGIWNSARRFEEATAIVDDAAGAAGRRNVEWQHAMQVWCGIGSDPTEGRASLAPAMEGMYGMPFERFERYSPFGTPDTVAEFLAPYVAAGCRTFNLIACAAHLDTAAAGAAEIRRLLNDVDGTFTASSSSHRSTVAEGIVALKERSDGRRSC